MYGWVIFARLILSWLRIDVDHPIISFLYRVTEPVLRPARQLIPPAGGLDFSPIIVFIVLRIVGNFV
ncbi:MAG TPA: YggT family protein, partial [Limnochordia bacterium]|nr:YggT family protein [Limnochordia bacterium]